MANGFLFNVWRGVLEPKLRRVKLVEIYEKPSIKSWTWKAIDKHGQSVDMSDRWFDTWPEARTEAIRLFPYAKIEVRQ